MEAVITLESINEKILQDIERMRDVIGKDNVIVNLANFKTDLSAEEFPFLKFFDGKRMNYYDGSDAIEKIASFA